MNGDREDEQANADQGEPLRLRGVEFPTDPIRVMCDGGLQDVGGVAGTAQERQDAAPQKRC